MPKFKVTCEYYIEAKNLKEAELEVFEDCGIDFGESHIIVKEISQ